MSASRANTLTVHGERKIEKEEEEEQLSSRRAPDGFTVVQRC